MRTFVFNLAVLLFSLNISYSATRLNTPGDEINKKDIKNKNNVKNNADVKNNNNHGISNQSDKLDIIIRELRGIRSELKLLRQSVKTLKERLKNEKNIQLKPEKKQPDKNVSKKREKHNKLTRLSISNAKFRKNSLPLSVIIIDKERLDNLNTIDIFNSLKYLPGFFIAPLHGSGFDSLVGVKSFSGFFNDNSITVNGVKIYNSFNRGYYSGGLNAKMFDKVEVYPFIFSPVSGSGKGVINFSTPIPKKGMNYDAGFSYGTGGYKNLINTYARGSYRNNLFYVSGLGSFFGHSEIKMPEYKHTNFSSDERNNSAAKNVNGLVMFGFADEKRNKYVDFTALLVNRNNGFSGPDNHWTNKITPDDSYKERGYYFSVNSGIKIFEKVFLKFTPFINYTGVKQKFTGIENNVLNLEMGHYGYNFSLNYYYEKSSSLCIGFKQELRTYNYADEINPGDNYDAKELLTYFYLELKHDFGDVDIYLGLNLSLHNSYNEDALPTTGLNVQTLAGIFVKIIDQLLAMRLEFSNPMKLPDLTKTRWPMDNYDYDLDTENYINIKLGAESVLGKVFFMKSFLCLSISNNEIEYEAGSFRNSRKTYNLVVYVDSKLKPLANHKFGLQIFIPFKFSYSIKKDRETDKLITDNNEYKYVFITGFGVEIEKRFYGEILIKYVKNRELDTGNYEGYYFKYFFMDINLHYQFKVSRINFKAFIKLLNVLNTKYSLTHNQVTYTMPGFTFIAGLNALF